LQGFVVFLFSVIIKLMVKFNPQKFPPNLYKERPKISEVISVVAHQLRHPISVIKSYLEALISEDFGKINSKQKEYLVDCLENVKRMAKNVNDLLEVSLIEEGKYELKLQPLSLEEITESVVNNLALWAEAANCEVIFQKPKAKLPKVLADPLKIRQVLENLISNAIKYKKAGRAKIEINLVKRGKEILFSCEDNGIGIAKEDFKKVFTKFYRSEEAMEIDPSGAGLGLYLNKAIIELSGGKIWFSKNKDFGMTFYFTLPIIEEKT